MIEYGCLCRYFNPYKEEIAFAKRNSFSFVQLWYENKGLILHKNDKPFLRTIKSYSFPTIIHALLDINDFEKSIRPLLKIIKELKHKEVIIHPICQIQKVFHPNEKLNNVLQKTAKFFKGITVYLENNPKPDSFFHEEQEIEYIFKKNPQMEFLLDIAHAKNYEQMKNLIKIKYPKILHVSDRKFSVEHEHLPIGVGDINFRYIFNKLLKGFQGKIIFELLNDEDIILAKRKINDIIKYAR